MTPHWLVLTIAVFLPLQEAPEKEERLEDLYRTASLWQVGENREKVAKAREELIAFGDDALQFLLEKKMSTRKGLEYRALSAVMGGIGEAAIDPLLRKLQTATPAEGANVARLLGELGSKPEEPTWREKILASREDLHALLARDDMALRVAVLDALSKLGDAEAVAPILDLLGDPAERIRRAAAVSLGKIGDPRAVPALAPMLADPLFSIRRPVAHALGSLGEEGERALRGALVHDDFKVRGLAAETLGKRGVKAARGDLLGLLQDPVGPVRAYAAEALGSLGGPESLSGLQEALKTETETFPRLEMAKGIARIQEGR